MTDRYRTLTTLLLILILLAVTTTELYSRDKSFWDISQGSPAGILEALQDCSLEGFVLVTDLPIPKVDSLPQYYSADSILISWDTVSNTEGYSRYGFFVQCAVDPDFLEIQTCDRVIGYQGFDSLDNFVVFHHLPDEIPYYFRVFAVALTEESVSIRGAASNVVFSNQDKTAPYLEILTAYSDSYDASSLAVAGKILVRYEGSDNYPGNCDSIILWQKDDSLNTDTIVAISHCEGEVFFRPSEEFDRKTICARLIDGAGNIGNVKCASTVLVDKPHNYPNPFNPANHEHTNFVVRLSEDGPVTIRIYDLFNNLITQIDARGIAGINDGAVNTAFQWDGQNDEHEIVSSGGYICVISTTKTEHIIKIAVEK